MLTQLKQKAQAIRVVGGKGAVSDSIYLGFAKYFDTARISGSSRYETNTAVNAYVTTSSGTAPTTVWVATGKNFPDALSSAVPAGNSEHRLVLSDGTCIPKPVVSEWITGSSATVKEVNLVGGSGVLGESVAALSECQ